MSKNKRIVFISIVAVVAVAISATLTIVFGWEKIFINSGVSSVYMESSEYPFSMFFFNVGRANAVLIRSEDYNILIDSGMERVQTNMLDTFELLEVEKLDLVVLTHPDKDHIGNMADIVNSISVSRFITCENGEYELTQIYSDLLTSLKSKGIDVEYAKAGDSLAFGDLQLDVVSPNKVYESSNNNSVAIKLKYKNFSAFLSGDIEKEAEEDILQSGVDISADILCVAHHGSGGSSTEDFLNAVSPEIAIVSVEQNDYLPSNKTLSRLVNIGCEIYRTDECGTICVVCDDKDYKIITEYN